MFKPSLLPCALFFVTACAGASNATTTADEPTDTAQEELRACPTHEIAFTRPTGCANDGSVEFCVPKGDTRLVARLHAISPDITFLPSSGRARCDTATQDLGLYPTRDGVECHGEQMTRAAWRDVCAIAAERAITRIVPTVYE